MMDKEQRPEILIVDDSEMNRMLLAEILQDEYALTEAADGIEAVSLLRENVNRFSLILLDLMMPGMDGFKVMEVINEYHWIDRLPVIIISSDTSANAVDRAFNLGAVDFISRPFDMTVVHHRIMNTLLLRALKLEREDRLAGGEAGTGETGQARLRGARTEYDVWTGLNRDESFYRKADACLKEHREKEYCLLAIDIEHFKLFNELYGRDAGDQLLFDIASHLKASEKELGGIAGYFGEDNFALLVPQGKEYIQEIQKQIMDGMSQYGGYSGFVPVIGVYEVADRSLSAVAMHDRALMAVSRAKADYNTRICYYEEGMLHEMQDEHILMLEIQNGIRQNEFVFFVQPQCNINTGRIVGGEALVRWDRGEKGFVSPGRFIPLIEKTGYVTEVDRYIWESVCRWQRSLLDRGIRPVPVSVNVSQKDLFFMDVVGTFKGLIEKYRLSPRLVKVEITESAYAKDLSSLNKVVEKLQNLGFAVYMDDFGSGYSSLNMLRNVSMDVLKLDMKFLDFSSEENGKGMGILESVVDMTHMMGMPVIVEGAETEAHINALKNIGCSYAQGYYFYKPMPVADFEALLSTKGKVDYGGVQIKQVEQLHIREFLDQNLFSTTLLNNILGAVAFYEMSGDQIQIIRMNERYFQLAGIRSGEDEEYRENFLRYVYEADWGTLVQIFRDADQNPLNGGEGGIHYLRKDGTTLFLQLHVFFLHERNGSRVYCASVQDMTKMHENEQRLANSLKALSMMVKIPGNHSLDKLSEENRRQVQEILAQSNLFGMIGCLCKDGLPLLCASDALISLLGYRSYEELENSIEGSVINLIHPDDRERVWRDVRQDYRVGGEYFTTYRMRRKDKSWFWVVDKGRIVNTEDGCMSIIGVCTDITEIIQVQEKMAERNAMLLSENEELQFLNQDIPGGYHRCANTPEMDFLYVSETFLKIFGYTRQEIQDLFDDKLINMLHPDDRYKMLKFAGMGRSRDGALMEYRMQARDGYIWVIDQSRLIRNGGDSFFQGIVMDVTETVELRRNMQILKEHAALDILLMTASGGKRHYQVLANGLSRDRGYSAEEAELFLNTKEYYEVMAEPDAEDRSLAGWKAIEEHRDYEETFRIPDMEGRMIQVHLTATFAGESGEGSQYLVVCEKIRDL